MKIIYDKLVNIKRTGGILSLIACALLGLAFVLGCSITVFVIWISENTLRCEDTLATFSPIENYPPILLLFAIGVGLTAIIRVALSEKLTLYRHACRAITCSIILLALMIGFGPPIQGELIYHNSHAGIGQAKLKILHSALLEYSYDHSRLLPQADKWCDELKELMHKDYYFSVFQVWINEKGRSDFAFNKNLSEMKPADIPGNTIMLFEAHGQLNNSGGEELLTLPDKEYRYAFILFADGTTGRYWQDGVLTLYNDKPEDDYLPLKWKP